MYCTVTCTWHYQARDECVLKKRRENTKHLQVDFNLPNGWCHCTRQACYLGGVTRNLEGRKQMTAKWLVPYIHDGGGGGITKGLPLARRVGLACRVQNSDPGG